MKRFLIYFTIALGFISCGLSDKKITQAEFERLFTHDSIESINLNANDKEAKIRIKPFHENKKTYILPIESADSFETSFNKLRNTLNAQNIHSSYSMSTVSGSEWPFYLPLISPLFFLCTLILFLIAVIDVLKNRFETATDKLTWFLVVFLIPIIGPILYVSIGRKQKLAKN